MLDNFTQGKITMVLYFPKLLPQKECKKITTNYLRQNTVCLKPQIYPSPENFIQALFLALVTFRKSDKESCLVSLLSVSLCLSVGVSVCKSVSL